MTTHFSIFILIHVARFDVPCTLMVQWTKMGMQRKKEGQWLWRGWEGGEDGAANEKEQ